MTEHDDITQGYRVLARKYRPSSFDELIGQDSLVQTLSNALAMGRLAHAFILTGLRGIGKTTTARIIARGLNCVGTDGKGEPTLKPCGQCSSCVGIADSRHVDVIEMDAASNTGVDDVREIIDGVGYKPLTARFKIYIIDEVHMLSKNAFNALLKTLEEPPEAVKFIFATTEIRKVPVTVLSRCQRFDLRRVPNQMMADHLKSICDKENISAEDSALDLISNAAEGSVRDALSLLDQAAALTADKINEDSVADMLGQAGRAQALNILSLTLNGKTADALNALAQAIGHGAEPSMVLNDLLNLTHIAARLATGGNAQDTPEAELEKLSTLAKELGMAKLGRAWQILLKGHAEINVAPNHHAAADMIIIRLAHASTLPTPADLVKKLEKTTPDSNPATPDTPPPQPQPQNQQTQQKQEMHSPQSLRQLVRLFEDQGELLLAATIKLKIKPVKFQDGQLDYQIKGNLEANVIEKITRLLHQWTGIKWILNEAQGNAEPTLDEQDAAKIQKQIDDVSTHPIVSQVLTAFPGAKVQTIENMETPEMTNPDHHDEGDGKDEEEDAQAQNISDGTG